MRDGKQKKLEPQKNLLCNIFMEIHHAKLNALN